MNPPSLKPTILIVDDVAENLAVLREILKSDYSVLASRDGETAIEIASGKRKPDLILLDVMMPGMSGYEVCQRLKSEPGTQNIPVIFVTARVEVEDEQQGFELGAVDYVTKPINPHILTARVKTQLLLKRQADELREYALGLQDLIEVKSLELVKNEVFLTHILDSLSNLIVILDSGKRIIKVNCAWKEFCDHNNPGLENYGFGQHYISAELFFKLEDATVIEDLMNICLEDGADEESIEYLHQGCTVHDWYLIRITKFILEERVYLAVSHICITDRKTVQIELEKREHELRTVMNSAPMMIHRVDQLGTILYENQADQGMEDDPVGSSIFDLVYPGDREYFKESLKPVYELATVEQFKVKYLLPGGVLRYLLVTASPYNLSNEETQGLLVYVDVTKETLSSQQVIESKRRFQRLSELTKEGLLYFQNSGEILDANRRAIHLLNISMDQLLTSKIENFLPLQTWQKIQTSLLGTPGMELYGHSIRNREGEIIPVDLTVYRFSEEEGIGEHVLAFRDISERVRKDQKIQQLENRFSVVTEHFPLVVYSGESRQTPQGVSYAMEWVSPNLKQIMGIEESDYLSSGIWFESIDTRDKPKVLETLAAVTGGKKSSWEIVYRKPVRGETRWFSNRGRVLLDEDGQPTKTIGVCEDITEGRRLKDQLNQTEKMKSLGQLAGGIAHDFNNLLTSILSYGGFVHDSLPPESSAKSDMKEVLNAGEMAARLTRQLLTFARQQPLELQTLDLNEVIYQVMSMLKRTFGTHIEIKVVPYKQAATVKADPIQIEQLILNLCVNARDAMPGGGKIEIKVMIEESSSQDGEVGDSSVVVSVSDSGTGMDEATMAKIFEPFFTTKALEKGTGMGLSTCFGVVQGLGGNITVESRLGEGSTFFVSLPLCLDSAVNYQSEQDQNLNYYAGDEVVLVVEDEPGLQRLAKRILEEYGYTIVLAKDGSEALELFEKHEHEIEAIFTDINMPLGNGFQFANWVRKRNDSLPILLTTGFTEDSEHLEESRIPVVWKPYTPQSLLRRLKECIELSRSSVNFRPRIKPISNAKTANTNSGTLVPKAPLNSREIDSSKSSEGSDGQSILLVEDQSSVRNLIKRLLELRGFSVLAVASVTEGKQILLERSNFLGILCDLNLGEEKGTELFEYLIGENSELARRFVLVTGGCTDGSLEDFVSKGIGFVLHKPLRPSPLYKMIETLQEL